MTSHEVIDNNTSKVDFIQEADDIAEMSRNEELRDTGK